MTTASPAEDPKRLRIAQDVLRELYLYSGNQCAFPACSNTLLSAEGTLWGDIAHIEGVKANSARHNPKMTNEERRASSNLLLLCTKHHKTIDDLKLVDKYPVEAVRQMKEIHESTYRDAVATLIGQIGDLTVGIAIIYPDNLINLGIRPEDDENQASLQLVKDLADRLSQVPPSARDVLALIVKHGKLAGYTIGSKPIEITWSRLTQTVSGVLKYDLAALVNTLTEDGFLEQYTNGHDEIVLCPIGSTPSELGWDIFYDLKMLSNDEPDAIRRVICDLNFSSFQASI